MQKWDFYPEQLKANSNGGRDDANDPDPKG
jgi:hypothetical protein